MKVLFLTHHWAINTHHSSHSGYQQLIKYIASRHECAVVTHGKINEVKVENGITVTYVKPFMKRDFLFVRRLSISWAAKKIQANFDVVHALYTDCGYFQDHPNFFSTFHISPFVARGEDMLSTIFLRIKYYFIERKVINCSKVVFVVSNNLRAGIGKSVNKFMFVPHGINCDFWAPRPKKFQKNGFILCVGNNGLDRNVLKEVVEKNPALEFVIVGVKNFVGSLPNLHVLENISELELRDLYDTCMLFVRPMTFATANNSILEAVSMNKRILIGTPDGTYDYFNTDISGLTVVKTKDFAKVFSNEMTNIMDKNGLRIEDDLAIRRFALQRFDWNVVVNQIEGYYSGSLKKTV